MLLDCGDRLHTVGDGFYVVALLLEEPDGHSSIGGAVVGEEDVKSAPLATLDTSTRSTTCSTPM
jgi:hypothetical protein